LIEDAMARNPDASRDTVAGHDLSPEAAATPDSFRAAAAPARRIIALAVALAAAAGFLAVRWANPLSDATPGEDLSDWLTLSLSVLVESFPFVVLGIVIAIVLRHWLPPGLLLNRLPRRGIPRRAVISLFGILLPVCECGNVPVTRGFLDRGMSVGDALTFLIAAPVVNPVTIITTWQAFGWQNGVLVARVGGALLLANLVGWLFSLHPEPRSLLVPAFAAGCDASHAHAGGGRMLRRLRESGDTFRSETASMLLALVAGGALAGAIQVFVPRSTLVALGGDPLWGVVALTVLAFIVSVCSTVDAFFILAVGSTFLPGALVAFLLLGAILDVRMLALLRTTFRWRLLGWLLAIVVLFSITTGVVVNALV
jgi:uncharacterized membrane protein YraQ (UPF0718 family)